MSGSGSSVWKPPLGDSVEECWAEVGGARMRYLRAGSGPPVVLLHGLLGYSFSWRFTIPALVKRWTVVAPDLPGTGFSDRSVGLDHSLRATAQRLLRFAESIGLSSFDLVGTSHGGAVAMMAAAECARGATSVKINRLVLVAPVNPYSPHGKRLAPFLGSRIGSTLFRAVVPLFPFTQEFWLQRMFGDRARVPADSLAGYRAPLAIPGLFEHGLNVVRTWESDLKELEASLPTISLLPVFLMWGEKDGAVYASSAVPLAKCFSNAQTVTFKGIGHLPYEECPEEFNRELVRFLESDPLRSEMHTAEREMRRD